MSTESNHPSSTEGKTKATKAKHECADCGESITIWWTDDEGAKYCAECFAYTGASCGGCAHEDCRLCNEEEEEECETCGTTTNMLHQGKNGIYRGKWCCLPCLAKDDALKEKTKEQGRWTDEQMKRFYEVFHSR